MAKQKKNLDSGNPIIVNWVQSNEQKLNEIKTVNPELFTGMTMALDYLNKYLGGQSEIVINPEPKKSEDPIQNTPQKQTIEDVKFKSNSEADALAFQNHYFALGVTWQDGNTTPSQLDSPYFYVTKGFLYRGNLPEIFDDKKNREVTLDELRGKTKSPSKLGWAISIADVLDKTTFSEGMNNMMLNDFKRSGYENVADLVGNDENETSKNIQQKIDGFASGKNTYLQANMIAKVIHDPNNNYLVKFNPTQKTQLVPTKNIKIEVATEEEAIAFQQWAFSQGFKWYATPKRNVSVASQTTVKSTEERYFKIDDEGVMYYYIGKPLFMGDPLTEVTLKDLGITVQPQVKQHLSTPKLKADVQDLYNELDDLDI